MDASDELPKMSDRKLAAPILAAQPFFLQLPLIANRLNPTGDDDGLSRQCIYYPANSNLPPRLIGSSLAISVTKKFEIRTSGPVDPSNMAKSVGLVRETADKNEENSKVLKSMEAEVDIAIKYTDTKILNKLLCRTAVQQDIVTVIARSFLHSSGPLSALQPEIESSAKLISTILKKVVDAVHPSDKFNDMKTYILKHGYVFTKPPFGPAFGEALERMSEKGEAAPDLTMLSDLWKEVNSQTIRIDRFLKPTVEIVDFIFTTNDMLDDVKQIVWQRRAPTAESETDEADEADETERFGG